MLLSGAGMNDSAVAAERFRRVIAAEAVKWGGSNLSVSVSIGVATYPIMRASVCEELVTYADKALYAAKEAGRNRVMVNDGYRMIPFGELEILEKGRGQKQKNSPEARSQAPQVRNADAHTRIWQHAKTRHFPRLLRASHAPKRHRASFTLGIITSFLRPFFLSDAKRTSRYFLTNIATGSDILTFSKNKRKHLTIGYYSYELSSRGACWCDVAISCSTIN